MVTEASEPWHRRLRDWMWVGARPYLLLALWGALVWAAVIHPGEVNYDSLWLVLENRLLGSGDPRVIPTILYRMDLGTRLALGAEYLPVRDLSVLLDFMLFGSRFALHHLSSVIWYLGGCLLLLALFARLLGNGWRAFLAALLFTVHPIHVESVAWLASRKDVVSLAFSALGLLAFWMAREGRWNRWIPLLGFILAYWAKNTAISLPLLYLGLAVIVRGERPTSWRWWVEWVVYGLVGALLVLLSMRVGSMVSLYAAHRGGSLASALLLETRVILFELGLLFWPARLSVMYPEPSPLPLLHPISVAALAFHLAALASVPLLARRRPLVSFGIFWFYATLLPVAQIIPLQNLIADRYLILPVGGVILALVGSLPASGTRLGSLALRWLAILALALSWRSVDRSLDWRSSVSLWSEALRVNPRLGGVAGTLAEALVEEGRLDEAEAVLLEGLRWYPDDPILLQSLGWVYMKAGRPAEAEGTWRRCLARDPERRKAANNLAVLLIKLGRAEEAVPLASGLVARNPRYADAYNTLGAALLESGRLAEARETLLQAVAMSPYTARPVCNLGSALSLAGETAEAERWWRRCLELNPSSEIARKGLAGPRSMEE